MIDLNFNPPAKDLRIFAALQIVFFVVVAWVLHQRGYSGSTIGLVCVVSGLVGLIGMIAPTTIRWIYVGWMAAVFPIGWIVSHVLLGVIYFGVFTPYAVIMRIRGRDRLERRFDPAASTYWSPHKQEHESKRYFRQF